MIYCAATDALPKLDFLAKVVEDHMGLVSLPPLLRLPLGKPYLLGHQGVDLSYSHCGDVLFAAAGRGALGADVERIHPRLPGLPARCCDERELAWFTARGGHWADFYTLWTLKEARAKCTGEGIGFNPRTVCVPLLEADESVYFDGFTFRSYRLRFGAETYCAAICAKGRVKLPKQITLHGAKANAEEGREQA
jgi:Phosphopantetheinyl transferase